jgi:carboxyl-terminal processing protease
MFLEVLTLQRGARWREKQDRNRRRDWKTERSQRRSESRTLRSKTPAHSLSEGCRKLLAVNLSRPEQAFAPRLQLNTDSTLDSSRSFPRRAEEFVKPRRRNSGLQQVFGSGFQLWPRWYCIFAVTVGLQTVLWTELVEAAVSHVETTISAPARVVYEAYGILRENHIQRDAISHDWLDAALQPSPPQDFATARQRVAEHLIRPLHDRYTRLVAPEQFARLLRFDATGLGLLLRAADAEVSKASLSETPGERLELGILPRVPVAPGDLYIASPPVAGTAAAAAGLQAGDVIDSINGENVRGGRVAPFEAAALMQGAEGGSVVLEIRGRGPVELTRDYRNLAGLSAERAVEFERLGRIGMIRIREFNAWTLPQTEAALSQLLGAGAPSRPSGTGNDAETVDRLVLDLRRNHGGSLEEALDLAGLFLGGSVPVALFESSHGDVVPITSREPNGVLSAARTLPLVVLIDHETASASEILAGALRDYCRAALISLGFFPDHTYGKAMVQGVYGLSDGSGLVATIGHYRTPVRHEELQDRGLRAERHIPGLWSLAPMPWRAALAEQALFGADTGTAAASCEQQGIAQVTQP